MPDFDYNKDQLIMDFRSGDELIVAEMSFNACLKDQCKEFNLLDFGAKNETILVKIFRKTKFRFLILY